LIVSREQNRDRDIRTWVETEVHGRGNCQSSAIGGERPCEKAGGIVLGGSVVVIGDIVGG
jgi:hypothetical protein